MLHEDKSWDPAYGGTKPSHPIYSEGKGPENEESEHTKTMNGIMFAIVFSMCVIICMVLCCLYCKEDKSIVEAVRDDRAGVSYVKELRDKCR